MMYGYRYPGMMSGWGFYGLGFIFEIVFWVVLIVFLIKMVKHFHSHQEPFNTDRPLEILKERYAKGEIEKKQFEEMKKDLK